jgi:hypothetical protein
MRNSKRKGGINDFFSMVYCLVKQNEFVALSYCDK